MAGEHHFVTGTYIEVNELLQSAREVKDHVGGRKMTEAKFQEYNRNIVARDLELVSLVKDLRHLRQVLAAVSPEGDQTKEEKARIKLKLRLIEWDTTFTELNIKRVLDHAQSLEGKLKSRYLSSWDNVFVTG